MGKKRTYTKQQIAIIIRKKIERSNQENLVNVAIKTHKDKKDGHPHIIMGDIDTNHISVGLSTHQKKGKGKKAGTNFTMEKSPLDDGKHSYMRRQGTVAPKAEYENPRQGTLTPKDYAQAKVYAERAKQKYLQENVDKKK